MNYMEPAVLIQSVMIFSVIMTTSTFAIKKLVKKYI